MGSVGVGAVQSSGIFSIIIIMVVKEFIVALSLLAVVDRSLSWSCAEGDSWNDGCNNCFCSNGHAVCTEKSCVPALDACEDISPNCAINADQCHTSTFVQGRCRKTCGLCGWK